MCDFGAADPEAFCVRCLHPKFLMQALRHVVQQNPHILQPMLNELGKQNPQLLALINANQVRDSFPVAIVRVLACSCWSRADRFAGRAA